jgi:NAD(P)-dependent dehydrogenase (short-subunit alcohol dehydrogenase family)
MSNKSKIVLITGATSGIGRMTALHLAKLGHHVIASGRKVNELAKLKQEAAGLKLDTIVLEVTSKESIANAVGEVEKLTDGRGPDVLVNNAGFGVLGPTAEITDAEIRRQYETNVFGLMSVTRAFLPKMRERKSGRIINVSSVGGRITLPFFGAYNSTKYAVEALSDALRYELRPLGIDVALIEPGVIRTNFESTAIKDLEQFEGSVYSGPMSHVHELSQKFDRFAANPIVIAKAIARAVKAGRPSARYVAPRSTYAILWMSALLPRRVWDWAMRKMGYLHPKHLVATPMSTPAEAAKPVEARAAAN